MKTWEDIRQSELSKTEKGKYHVTSLTCRAKVSKCIPETLSHQSEPKDMHGNGPSTRDKLFARRVQRKGESL